MLEQRNNKHKFRFQEEGLTDPRTNEIVRFVTVTHLNRLGNKEHKGQCPYISLPAKEFLFHLLTQTEMAQIVIKVTNKVPIDEMEPLMLPKQEIPS